MRSLTYFRAGVGPAGRTPPTVYETLAEARQAVIVALEELAEQHTDDQFSGVRIDRVLQALNADPEATRFLDFFDLGTDEYVAFIGTDTVRP
jgi:hypothetical protein